MPVTNRLQMAQILSERMTRTYTALSERQQLEPDTSLVKTYLIEAHAREHPVGESLPAFIRRVTAAEDWAGRARLRVSETEDNSLALIEATVNQEPVTMYVDAGNPRFWLVHSLNSSNALDPLVVRLTSSTPELDHAWLPSNLLEWVARTGSFRGLGLDYDRRELPDVDFESDDAPVEFLKMQLWGSQAGRVLALLREQGAFPHEATLSKVKVKYWLNQEDEDQFSLDDIKFDGKITARGTSFASHVTLMSSLYSLYQDQIVAFESVYSIRAREDNSRLQISGEPIMLAFDRPIASLPRFLEHLFSASTPFRLWGVPVEISEDYYRVNAVDLHVGCRLGFEISPEYCRVYLYGGGCGNSLLRLYVNLQHYYDAGVRALGQNGQLVFQF